MPITFYFSRTDVGLSYLQDRTEESILSREKNVQNTKNTYVLKGINTKTQIDAQKLLKIKNPNPLIGYPETHVLQRAYAEISSVRNKGKLIDNRVVLKVDKDSKSSSAMKMNKEEAILSDKSKFFFFFMDVFVCICMFY